MKDASNILQENLFVVLVSSDMMASTRFFDILHVAIFLLFGWLTGNTHKLCHREWGTRSMGQALNLIHDACQHLVEDPGFIHNELFMMHIFDKLLEELPESKAHLEYQFENKTTDFVEKSETKALPLKMLIKELFTPSDRENKYSTDMLEKLAVIGIQAMIDELEDKTKATYKYLSISGTEFWYKHYPKDVKA